MRKDRQIQTSTWWTVPTPIRHARVFPVREAEYVQVGRGPSDVNTTTLMGRDFFAFEVETGPESIWTILPDPDWVGFVMPLSMQSEYKVDGWIINPQDVVFLDGRSDYTTSGARRRSFFIGVRREVFARACANLTGTDWSEFGRGHRLIELKEKPNELYFLVRCAFVAGIALGPKHGLLTLPPLQERDIICAVAEWLTTKTTDTQTVWMDRKDPFRVVEAAKATIRNSNLDQISISELCASAGVGKTRLHECFVDVHGISPGQYLIHHRLSVARELLLSENSQPVLVKQVALQLGFSNSGRFAKRYSEVFGHLPHQDLCKNAAQPSETVQVCQL